MGLQALLATAALAVDAQKPKQTADNALTAIHQTVGGRLGVALLDTGSNKKIEYHARDRFPMCSTFKFLAAAAVLHRVDVHQESLERNLSYGPEDLLEWAPITKRHVGQGGMTVRELCAAAIEYSDSTAANLLLKTIGGPEGLTQYARSLGDAMTRLDRTEPTLNTGLDGDERDTTTPDWMLQDLRAILLADKLSAASRQQLEAWLVANTTGNKRIRAGLPKGWRVGDKTGTGENRSTGDIAIVWRPNRAPILVVVYTQGSTVGQDKLNAVFAAVGRLVGESF